MIRNKKISSAFVLALIFLITHHSLLITVLHAVTVDFYQDCESGNNGDLLTSAIMNASSHGTGTWEPWGNMWVSTNRVIRLPGTVTAGGVTYTDTGTRTWVVNDKYSLNSEILSIASAYYPNVTIACFLTPGVTVYVENGWDLVILDGWPTYLALTLAKNSQLPLSIGCHSLDDSGTSTQSSSRITVVPGKTYWVNLGFKGATNECLAAVFDPDTWTQVGNTASCYARGETIGINRFRFGRTDNHGNNLNAGTQTNYDNIMIDYTNAPFPLLPDISSDTTPPGAPGTVRDGATTGTDISSTTSRTQLSANWTQAADSETGISGYNYAIGSLPGATNITNWITLGNVLTVTKTGLTLTVGTTYYFSVKAINGSGLTGTATNSNGQVVISTAVADTTPPGAPGTVRDGATAGADISSTTSRTQLSANWTSSADVESGISGYNYAIGTSPGATNITNWTTLGNVLTVTKTGLSLSVGATYYFSVKAVNGVGLTSTATNSNGQVVVSTAVADTTPPGAPGTVRDGATAGTDDSFTYSTMALSANWTQASDVESGISGYSYAIGSSIGATNIINWITLGNVLTVTKTGLTLTVGTTYYFSVKATNGQGLTGIAGNSNGQYVKEMNTADTTPPGNVTEVRDGTGAGDDAYTYITTELSANWSATADAESGISRYLYAIGSSPGATNITNWTDNGVLTNITQTGLSLVTGTTYYFSIKAENGVSLQSTPANSDGACIISGELPPVISNVQSGNISQTGVTIIWDTDKQATSQVEYGITAVYGSQTTEDSSLVTAHSVAITGLSAGQAYHYRVISKDSDGNQGASADFTFTTLSTTDEVTDIKAYPNPCDFSNGEVIKFKVGSAGVEFGEIKIYTISGKLVRKLTGTGALGWDGTNEDGKRVTRGIYIYRIEATNGDTTIGKIAVK